MKLKAIPENILERLALVFNLAPLPLVDTQVAFNAARAIMAAAETGIFEALGKDKKTVLEVSGICNTNPAATKHLLDCLVGMEYINWNNELYSLKPKYYKWLLQEYPSNLIGKLRFQLIEWNWMAHLETYIRTGEPLHFHAQLQPAEWALYQQGMRDLSVNTAAELAKKIRLPAQAVNMLDIGGSHGLYSAALCKKHPGLTSTILELPGAIEPASAIAGKDDVADRINYKAGNALTDDLGEQEYDLVMINNVVHHFTAEENLQLAKKVAHALKPGGIYAIGEFIRLQKPGDGGVVAATSNLYFAFTSASGTWSLQEIRSWQQAAGLSPQKEISFITLPGFKTIIAGKSL
jgi:2-polyprenyl-3-methyl-5-hydroxy-6-metoxy-1,4-benzoquinol methylase